MDFVLVADHPGVQQANKKGYRDGMLWDGFYKPAIPIGEKRLLEHLVDTIIETNNKSIIYAATNKPEQMLGEKATYVHPLNQEYIDDPTPLEDIGLSAELGEESTFQKKILAIEKNYTDPSEFIAVGGADVLASKQDIAFFTALAQSYPQADFVYPFIHADVLIEKGLREPGSKKLYHFRDAKKNLYHVATPNFFLLKPANLRLKVLAAFADTFYRIREDGFHQNPEKFSELRTSAFSEQWGSDSLWRKIQFFMRLGIAASRLSKTKVKKTALAGTFPQIANTLTHMRKQYRQGAVKFPVGDWHTLGYDIDTLDELAMVKELYAQNAWY